MTGDSMPGNLLRRGTARFCQDQTGDFHSPMFHLVITFYQETVRFAMERVSIDIIREHTVPGYNYGIHWTDGRRTFGFKKKRKSARACKG
ncbi:hypothetical protein WH47_01507 [Habropoda laboriosa]|uniref:Uncharacterized protein n=1 Tax=Habropoda laboriosa TaxID=597456 RepID=A0A0L7R0G9_9HYME|nr:hypothetical protein WH47_01507 [Habropoda laboriosa]